MRNAMLVLGFLAISACGLSYPTNLPIYDMAVGLEDPRCERVDMAGTDGGDPILIGPSVPIGEGQQIIPTPIVGTTLNLTLTMGSGQVRVTNPFVAAQSQTTFIQDPTIQLLRSNSIVSQWTYKGMVVVTPGKPRYIANPSGVVMMNGFTGVETMRSVFADIYVCATNSGIRSTPKP